MQDDEPVPNNLYDKEYFLTSCGGYEYYLKSRGEILGPRLQKALELAKLESGMRVLDVGCGRGEVVKHCVLKSSYAVGIDYSTDALKLATDVLDNDTKLHSLCRADAKTLPFTDKIFERIFLNDIIEHMHPAEVDKLLKEVLRVLSPNGQVIVHTSPNIWYCKYGYPILRWYNKLMNNIDLPKDPRDSYYEPIMHVNEQSIISLRTSLGKAGLTFKMWCESPKLYQGNNKIKNFLSMIIEKSPLNLLFSNNIYALAWRKHD